jgi:chaperone modulatory protein CbpM
MKRQIIKIYEGKVTTDEDALSLIEFCEICNQKPENIVELVEEGILEPIGSSTEEWRFPVEMKFRASKALRLRYELEINLAGVALAVELLDRIEQLEAILQRPGG